MTVSEKLQQLQQSIEQKAKACSRDPREIRLLLVTKTLPPERIYPAYEYGVREFGENRVQEMLAKKPGLPGDIRWHLIGHLQTNKVRHVVGETALIHSLDRWELVREIEKQAAKKDIPEVDCLIQIKTREVETQSGLAVEEAGDFAAGISPRSCVKIRGLMTIAPFTEENGRIRAAFRALKELRTELQSRCPGHDWETLSMGMSGDYLTAIEEGANLLRIGSLIFGERNY